MDDTCNLADMPTPSVAGSALILQSFYADVRCDNFVQLIDAAATAGFSSFLIYGRATIVDFSTTQKTSTIPSFFIPGYQNGENTLSSLTGLTSTSLFTTGPMNYHTMGSWRHYGENPNGVWTLKVKDTLAGNAGNLQNWLLQIMYNAPALATAPAAGAGTPTVSSSAAIAPCAFVVIFALLAAILH
jgi:hypothetical protein